MKDLYFVLRLGAVAAGLTDWNIAGIWAILGELLHILPKPYNS